MVKVLVLPITVNLVAIATLVRLLLEMYKRIFINDQECPNYIKN